VCNDEVPGLTKTFGGVQGHANATWAGGVAGDASQDTTSRAAREPRWTPTAPKPRDANGTNAIPAAGTIVEHRFAQRGSPGWN